MLNVFIDPNDSLPLLAVMLKIGSLSFIVIIGLLGSLLDIVNIIKGGSLSTPVIIKVNDSL